MRRRRTPDEQIAALRIAKLRVETALQRVESRAREAERKSQRRRRAILGEEVAKLFNEESPDGDLIRALLAKRVILPRHRSALGFQSS